MSEESWTIELGDNTYTVPRLALKYSRVAYPLCQKLSNAGLPARIILPTEPLQLTEDEMNDLAIIAFTMCRAAEPGMTLEAFEELPISAPQLYDAFFAARHATGGWRTVGEGKEPTGENLGTEEPQM